VEVNTGSDLSEGIISLTVDRRNPLQLRSVHLEQKWWRFQWISIWEPVKACRSRKLWFTHLWGLEYSLSRFGCKHGKAMISRWSRIGSTEIRSKGG